MRKYSLILSLVLSCSFSLQAQNLPLYSSPFEIKLTNAIATWTSDFGVRTQAITNNSFPSLSLWNSFNYNLGYPGSYGPLDPELFATSSNDILNTNIIQQLRFDRGPASFDVPLNELPRGVAPLSWMQQRLLAAAKGLISTHYQHTHLPGFNPANVTPSTNYSWSPVSDNPLLQTSQELIQGTTSTVANPDTNYGTSQPHKTLILSRRSMF
jgi:hypothetical protein